MTRSCANCRFGVALGADLARCLWVTGPQDEAGNRMPAWAHEIVANHPHEVGSAGRAETCPAYEQEDGA